MSEIKIKPKETIRKLDKNIVGVEKIKNNLITTKERINEITMDDDNNSGEEYAGRKIQNSISYTTRKGLEKTNELGKKSIKETQNNFIKEKKKINTFKTRIKEKRIINNLKKNTELTKKSIKTAENVAKTGKKVAKESIKVSQKAVKLTKHLAKITAQGIKVTIKATITAVKAIIAATKAIISAIIAGGWIAVVIIVVIVLIAGFVAAIFNNDGDDNYDSSQIPNSEIVLIAKSQIGNEGGDKFWKWYGFEEHVQWCACYVSWCANECGYIEKGIIPKFSVCSDGINWFKEKNEWHDRGESYYPIIGDIIFFDWNDNQDGISDHVGIVTRTDITNRTIYTIEGNTDDKCAERMYSFDDGQVMGYGSPKYE